MDLTFWDFLVVGGVEKNEGGFLGKPPSVVVCYGIIGLFFCCFFCGFLCCRLFGCWCLFGRCFFVVKSSLSKFNKNIRINLCVILV